MALLNRMSELLKANLNDLLDQAEDPVRMVRQVIRQLDDEIVVLRGQLQAAEARVVRRRGRLDESTATQGMWTRRAEEAVDAGDDTAGRQALKARRTCEEESKGLEAAWWEARQERDAIAKRLLELENQAQAARRKKESLLLRRRGDEPSSSFIPVRPPQDDMATAREIDHELERLKQERKK